MNKKFVIIAGLLMYAISAYFSHDYFVQQAKKGPVMVSNNPDANVADANVDPGTFTGKKTEECPLNGEMLTDQHKQLWETRRPLGVMIENHQDARPQSGLSDADVVYEFVAEGGITRFLAIFYCKDARLVGPVRSARIYFVSMLRGYGADPLYAHVGGANHPGPADALGAIQKLGWAGYNDMNQFSIPFPTYYRDYERLPGVATEHTMYSSTAKLWKFAKDKRKLTNVDEDGEKWDDTFKEWKFQDGKAGQGDVKDIKYDFWTGKSLYSAEWAYDVESNSYLRSHGDGKPHIDKNKNEPIAVKNVVVAFMKETAANDGYPGGHRLYGTVGTGKALIFQNGEAIEGTWSKKSDDDQIMFKDDKGKDVEFVRGEIWVSGLDPSVEVQFN